MELLLLLLLATAYSGIAVKPVLVVIAFFWAR